MQVFILFQVVVSVCIFYFPITRGDAQEGLLLLIVFQQLNQLLNWNLQTLGFSVTTKSMAILQISRMFQVYSIHYVLLSTDIADSIDRAFNRSCASQVVAFHMPRA